MANVLQALTELFRVLPEAADLIFGELRADIEEFQFVEILHNCLLMATLLLPQFISQRFAWMYLAVLALPYDMLFAFPSRSDTRSQPELPGKHSFIATLPSIQLDTSADEICALCREEYKDPIQLPCSHHFCRKCMITLIEWGSTRCLLCSRTLYDEPLRSDLLTLLYMTAQSIQMTAFTLLYTRRLLGIIVLLSFIEHLYLRLEWYVWFDCFIITWMNFLPAEWIIGQTMIDVVDALEGHGMTGELWPLQKNAACLFIGLFISVWVLQAAGARLVSEMWWIAYGGI